MDDAQTRVFENEQKEPVVQVKVRGFTGLCPHCLKDIEARYNRFEEIINPAEDSEYIKYKTTANQRFGAFSLPLCHNCWRRNCEKCEGCDMPMGQLAFSGAFGGILLRRTTIAAGDWQLHICDVCKAAGFTGTPCDCERCKRRQAKLCTL